MSIDVEHLSRQKKWSEETFGPGPRTLANIDHIRKELVEIEANPHDLGEWVDVIILAFDGAWRAGWEPEQTLEAIKARQARNEARTWPDWRMFSQNEAIEHDRVVVERPDWQTYFLNIAAAVASRADCRRAKHGAVIVKDHRIISTGYNGSPPGGKSCLAGECPRGLLSKEELAPLSADYTNCVAIHAESNAIAFADGRETRGATIYITGEPCDMCRKLIAAAGINEIIWPGM